jgi:beta-N-acetylhexosaminidase
MGYTGAIFSDDLSMAGARQLDGQTLSYTEASLAALQAGCDLVLLCNQSVDGGAAVDDLLQGMARAAEAGLFKPQELSEQRRLRLLPQTSPLNWDALMTDARYMQALDSV